MFRTIHSANQLSVDGAVSSWCEEFGLKPNERDTTSERFTTKENEQILKEVTPQEVNLLVQTPRNDDPVSGKRLRERFQNFETLEKDFQFTRVCVDPSFFQRVSIGMHYKTASDVDDGFGDRTPACREDTHPRADPHFRIYAAIPGRTIIGPVLQVRIVQFLGTHGIEIYVPSATRPDRNSWVVICPGKNRFVDELRLKDPGHNPASTELLRETSIAKESGPCSTVLEQSRIEETRATQSKTSMVPVYYSKEVISVGERKWNDVPACESFKRDSLSAEISKLVMRFIHHYDQDERETDAAIHWNSIVPKLRKAFRSSAGQEFSNKVWRQHIHEGNTKISKNSLLYFRAIQKHTGGNLAAPELMGHVAIPNKWKEFLFQRGCSNNVTSILTPGPIAGGRESKEGRQTSFFTPLNPFGDTSKPRKVHYHSNWKTSQDAVYRVNLARAQDKRITILAAKV